MIKDTLFPPKAKELDIPILKSPCFGLSIVKLRSHLGSGSLRPTVGGTIPFTRVKIRDIASIAPAEPKQ